MNKVLENELCIINYSDTLELLAQKTLEILEKKIGEYENFFEVKIDEKIVVNYFDDIENFRSFLHKIRKDEAEIPEYCKGTYDNNMVNVYIDPSDQLRRRYTSSHELFHIFYLKYILNDDYSKRITWFDEGMAQYMSGEKEKLKDEEEFKKYYLKVKEETKILPNMNALDHGKKFWNKDYNGYYLSYLVIRYLKETLQEKEFKSLLTDFDKIKEIGNNILEEVFKYYDEKINNKSR